MDWEKAASGWKGKKLLVLGDVMLDRYAYGTVHRVSPEAPVPVVDLERRASVLGGAANVAANIQALGGQAYLVGVVGEDRAGAELRQLLKSAGMEDRGLVSDPSRPTTTKTRVVAHDQQVVRIDQESNLPLGDGLQDLLWKEVKGALGRVNGVIISDYAKGVVTPQLLELLFAEAKAQGLP